MATCMDLIYGVSQYLASVDKELDSLQVVVLNSPAIAFKPREEKEHSRTILERIRDVEKVKFEMVEYPDDCKRWFEKLIAYMDEIIEASIALLEIYMKYDIRGYDKIVAMSLLKTAESLTGDLKDIMSNIPKQFSPIEMDYIISLEERIEEKRKKLIGE